MSVDSSDALRAIAPDAAPLLARVAAAEARADARQRTAIDDFFLAEDDRLDDRTRAAMAASLAATIGAVTQDLASHARRLLGAQGLPQALPTAAGEAEAIVTRLSTSGLLREPELMAALLGEVRQRLLADALVASRAPGNQGNLLARLTGCEDQVVASAATAFLRAGQRARADLPSTLHRRIVWWVAAALRERAAQTGDAAIALDHALAEAAQRSLAANDEAERLEDSALRLAIAIDARTDEIAGLLIDTLAEGLLALFIAVVAQARRIDFAEARALVLDPEGDRLWLALRAHGLDRETIARIGLALSDADPRRDIERFADELDAIGAIAPEDARASLAPLALHRDFRAALRALKRTAGA